MKKFWMVVQKWPTWDFPGSPVIRDPPSNAGDAGSILGQGLKSHKLQSNQAGTLQLLSLHAITKTWCNQK